MIKLHPRLKKSFLFLTSDNSVQVQALWRTQYHGNGSAWKKEFLFLVQISWAIYLLSLGLKLVKGLMFPVEEDVLGLSETDNVVRDSHDWIDINPESKWFSTGTTVSLFYLDSHSAVKLWWYTHLKLNFNKSMYD